MSRHVALFTEGVDWNFCQIVWWFSINVALFTEGVDWNNMSVNELYKELIVALFTEGVDWNH